MAGILAASPFNIGTMGNAGVLGQWNRIAGRSGAWGILALSPLAGISLIASTGVFAAAWRSNGLPIAAAWLLFATIAIGLGWICTILLLWYVARVAADRRRATGSASISEQQLQTAHRQVVEALEGIPIAVAIYDADERLVLHNAASHQLRRYMSLDDTLIGLTFEEVLTRLEPQFKAAYPKLPPDWKDTYLRRFRSLVSEDMRWANGRTMRLRQAAIRSGGTARIWIDITDLRRSEEAARAARTRFDLLVNSLPDTVFSTDRRSRITYLGSTQILGHERHELVALGPKDFVHPDDAPLLDQAIDHMRAHRGVPVAMTFRAISKSGDVRHMEVRMTAPKAQDNLGGELAVTGILRDVQAQHEIAERLRYELQRLESVVQSTGARILLVDRDMRFVFANRGFLDAVPGRSAKTVIGRPMREIINSPIDQAVFDAWFAAGPADLIAGIEYDNVTPDAEGRQRVYRVTANPVRDGQGRVQHIVFLAVEETERRAAELQLFAASRLATLGEMASGVAHEINQPLTVIRFAAEGLQDLLLDTPPQTPLTEAAGVIDEKLLRIVAQTERASTIIGDLKGFARKSDEAPRLFNVSEALEAAAHLLREQLRMSQIEQVLSLDAACPPVLGNSGRLQQVILNLILNARDAVQERDVPGTGRPRASTIELRTRYVPLTGKVIAAVEDDGPGIPAHVLPRVFEPFFTTKPTGKGTGLGLSVSHQIIRQMGGTIVAENRAEGGARFTITLDAVSVNGAASTIRTTEGHGE